MIVSLNITELQLYIHNQIMHFFPDGQSEKYWNGKDIGLALSEALERYELCYSHIIFFRDKDNGVTFYHLHADKYATLLYFFANSLYTRSGNLPICDRLLQLNRALHGLFISYKCKMPDIFFLDHPIGTVLGNNNYSDYLMVMQNVTVETASSEKSALGKFVGLNTGAFVDRFTKVGNKCAIGFHTGLRKCDVPDNSIVYTDNESGKKVTLQNHIWGYATVFCDF